MKNFKEINRTFTVKKNSIFNAVCKTRYLALLVVLIFTCGNAWAETASVSVATFQCKTTETTVETGKPVTYQFSGSSNTYNPVRWYSGVTLTIAVSSSYKITGVTITVASDYSLSNISVTSGGGTWSAPNWSSSTGSTSVVFSNSGSGQTRITGISVTYESASPATPYTVTFTKTDGSTEAIKESSVSAGVTPPVMSTPCDGWAFQGWSKSQSTSPTSTTVLNTETLTNGKYYPSSDVTLYPVYTKSPASPIFVKYEKYTKDPDDWSGKYLLSTGSYTATGYDGSNHLSCTSLTPGTTEYASYEFVVTKVATNKYSIKEPGGYYIGWSSGTAFTKNATAPTASDGGYLWLPSSSGYTQNVGTNTRKIGRKDNSPYDFRPYSNPSSSTYPIVYLYKRIEITKYYYSYPNCCTDPELAYGTASVTKTYGEDAFTNALTNSHEVAVTYALSSVSPAGCVSINASTGQVTINGVGSATITASSAAQTVSSVSYCADEASYTLTVNKANITPTLTYTPNSVAVGEDSSAPTVGGNPGSGGVTYAITSATPAGCATIDAGTGVVSGVAVGSVTVTATVAATDNYNGGTATANVTITAAAYFPQNKTLFFEAKTQSESAWKDDAKCKAWFRDCNSDCGEAPWTYWQADGDSYKKYYAVVIPSTGNYPYVTVQRYNNYEAQTLWGIGGAQTYSTGGGSNVIMSTCATDGCLSWSATTLRLYLRGDILVTNGNWESNIGEMADQNGGIWSYTHTNYAPTATSLDFKLYTNYNFWIGNTTDNANATLSGLVVGSTYNITATYNVNTHALVMSKTPVNYQVHFDMNDHGSAISSYTTVTPNSTISAPSDPSESGWTFGGWYTDDACTTGNEWDFANDPVTETMTLHAKWTRTPIIKLNDATENITVAFSDKAVDATTGYTLSFTVSGQYLTENIAIGKSGTDQAMFTVSPSTVTQSEGTAASTTINVTYKPSTIGSHSATLTLSSAGAVDRTVTLSGTAKWKVVWMTNGGEYTTTLVDNNTKPTFPDPAPTSCESGDGASTTFIGWTKQTWTGKKNQAYIDALTGNDVVHVANTTMENVTDNTTEYHAVYALASGSGSATYKKVTSGLSDYSGQYLLVFETDNICFDGSRSTGQSNTNLDASGNFRSVEISTTSNPYSIASTSTIDTYSFTISASQTSGKYYIQSASGYYIGSTNADDTGSNELLISTSTTYNNSISVSSGNATITGVNNILKCFKQSGQSDRFRYFKTTAGNVNPIQLYKYDPGITYSNYMTTCCENKVTLNSGSPSNGTVAFSPTGPIATCSSTASERQTTVTVTPNTGYKLTGWTKAVSGIALPDSTSAISTSSGNTAAQSNMYTFAQNANGSMSVTATFSPILVSSLKLKATQTGESDKIGDDLTMTCYPKEGQTGGNDPLNHSLNVKFHEVLPANALDKEYNWSVRVKATGAADWTNVGFTGNVLNNNTIINSYNKSTGNLQIKATTGTAEIKITAHDGSGVTAKVTITVANVSVSSISVDPTTMDVYAGQKKPVTITFSPANATDKVYTTGSYTYVTMRSSGSNPFYIEGNATDVVRNETVTVTSHDGSKTATIDVTVNPLPKATFIDIVHGKTDFLVEGESVLVDGTLTSTVSADGLTVDTEWHTPTHADVAKPATGNNCEKEHLHLVGWILKDWADANPTATHSDIIGAGATNFYGANEAIDLSSASVNGKTYYAVWAKVVTTP